MTEGFDLTPYTTFGVPARCDELFAWSSEEELRALFERGVFSGPWMSVGGGSNLLFASGRYRGAVLLAQRKEITFTPAAEGAKAVDVTAAAGTVLADLTAACGRRGLWGLENLAGIPGSVGGAVVQNAGAYGDETSRRLLRVKLFDTSNGSTFTLTPDQCRFGYRSSVFKHPEMKRCIITEATFRLSPTPAPQLGYRQLAEKFGSTDHANLTPLMLSEEVIRLRNAKLPDPAKVGSAGSFFKNPVIDAAFHRSLCHLTGIDIPAHPAEVEGKVKISAAWLIDQAGCKPLTAGGAALWSQMPLVIVNRGSATGADVVALMEMVQQAVARKFNIHLQPEVIII